MTTGAFENNAIIFTENKATPNQNYDFKELNIFGENISFTQLLGEKLQHIHVSDNKEFMLFFINSELTRGYIMYHDQACCESVTITDVDGDLTDLINSPILMAQEEVSKLSHDIEHEEDSFTWTFYKLATIKGYVTLRWIGESNGYYSESVDLSYFNLKNAN
jgi:hypothetical protein